MESLEVIRKGYRKSSLASGVPSFGCVTLISDDEEEEM